jgi:hypothetical protein
MSPPSDDGIKPWTIKGVPPEARNAAISAATRDGQNMGEWIARAIREKVQADAGRPRVPAVVEQPNKAVETPEPKFSLLDLTAAATSLKQIEDSQISKSLSSLIRGELRAHRVAAGQVKPRAPKTNGAASPA